MNLKVIRMSTYTMVKPKVVRTNGRTISDTRHFICGLHARPNFLHVTKKTDKWPRREMSLNTMIIHNDRYGNCVSFASVVKTLGHFAEFVAIKNLLHF